MMVRIDFLYRAAGDIIATFLGRGGGVTAEGGRGRKKPGEDLD